MTAEKKLLLRYGLNQGMHWFIIGIIIPVTTLFFLERGFNLGEIGGAFSLSAFTVFFLELPTGGFADSIGRKRVYLISVIFYVIAYLVMMMAVTMGQLMITAVFLGMGRALSSGSMDAWYIDEQKKLNSSEQMLQKNLAKIGVIIPAALGLGTLLGGMLPDVVGEWFSRNTSFGMYGGNTTAIIFLFLFQFVLTSILIKEDRSRLKGRIGDSLSGLPEILGSAVKYGLKNRNTLAVLVATAALGVGLAGIEQLWQPRFRVIAPDTGIWLLGLVSALYFLSASIGSALSPFLLKLTGYRYGLFLFLFRFIMGGFYIALSFAINAGSFIPLYLILFLTHGVTGAPEMTIYNRGIPSNKRSTMLSLNSLFLQGGGGLGALLAGNLALHYSIPITWLITGGVLTISAFSYLQIRERACENRI